MPKYNQGVSLSRELPPPNIFIWQILKSKYFYDDNFFKLK